MERASSQQTVDSLREDAERLGTATFQAKLRLRNAHMELLDADVEAEMLEAELRTARNRARRHYGRPREQACREEVERLETATVQAQSRLGELQAEFLSAQNEVARLEEAWIEAKRLRNRAYRHEARDRREAHRQEVAVEAAINAAHNFLNADGAPDFDAALLPFDLLCSVLFRMLGVAETPSP